MSQLIRSPLSSQSSMALVRDPGLTADLLLADAIGFLHLEQREEALECIALLQLDAGIDAPTTRALFNGLELEPTSRDAAQLLKDACAHASIGARESGLQCLVMALADKDAMFELPRAIERAVRALNLPVWDATMPIPALTIHLS